MTKPIIVIGAGMVGVSTALWLQRAGRRVILMDRGKPGMGASYGNAGLIAQWAVVPINTPSIWKDAPKYLLNPNSPLFLKWTHLPKMLPWIAKFMSNANPVDTDRMVNALIPLLTDAVDQHKSLVSDTPLEHWISNSKFSYSYPTCADFKHDAFSWDMKARAGFTPTVLTGNEIQDAEPILGPATGCLAVLEGQGHITNPAGYITQLVAHFKTQGGEFIQAEVKDFIKSNGRITSVETSQTNIPCMHAIITAGIWSKDLMRKLNLEVPLETERGYHVIYKNPSQMPNDPMMITKGKFAVNPMDMGLRCAGIVELGDHHAGPSKQPIALLKRCATEVFPTLKYSGTEEWLGFRPSTPDSIPVIGEIGDSGIYTGFGHQHVGLTAGPKTGRLLAQMITGETPNIDLKPYTPARYLG